MDLKKLKEDFMQADDEERKNILQGVSNSLKMYAGFLDFLAECEGRRGVNISLKQIIEDTEYWEDERGNVYTAQHCCF